MTTEKPKMITLRTRPEDDENFRRTVKPINHYVSTGVTIRGHNSPRGRRHRKRPAPE